MSIRGAMIGHRRMHTAAILGLGGGCQCGRGARVAGTGRVRAVKIVLVVAAYVAQIHHVRVDEQIAA